MKKLFVDTNVFLRFILQDIPEQHVIARSYFEKAKVGEVDLVLCSPVVFELDFVLSKYYKFVKKDVANAIGVLLTLPYLEVEDREAFQQAMIEYAKGDYDLVDCFIYAKALLQEGEVLSFDRKLGKKSRSD